MVMPEIVIVFALPTFLLAKDPVMEAVERLTASPDSTPDNAAPVVSKTDVAELDALYTRLLAVMPVTVSVFSVIEPVAVGCTRV